MCGVRQVPSAEGGAGTSAEEQAFAAEFHRQRNYLERSIRVLKSKAVREESKVGSLTSSRFSENGLLLVEINSLRKENKGLAKRAAFLEAEPSSIKSQQRIAAAKRAARGSSRGTRVTMDNASSVGFSRATTPGYLRKSASAHVFDAASRAPLMSYNRLAPVDSARADDGLTGAEPGPSVHDSRSLTLDVRIPSTVITDNDDGDNQEGDDDAGGGGGASPGSKRRGSDPDGEATGAGGGDNNGDGGDDNDGSGQPDGGGRERELQRNLRRREVEVANLMRSNREQERTMAAQQAEIERLQQHVRRCCVPPSPTIACACDM